MAPRWGRVQRYRHTYSLSFCLAPAPLLSHSFVPHDCTCSPYGIIICLCRRTKENMHPLTATSLDGADV